MPASTVTTLTEYANDVLVVAVDALDTTSAGVPDRAYVDTGPPAWDCCPFLTVYVAALTEAPTSPLGPGMATARRRETGYVIFATYVINAIRCAPPLGNNGLPTVAAKQAVSATVLEDGWALLNHFEHAIDNNEIFERCIGVIFDGGVPISERGGCVGWQFQIRAPIDGIPNPGPSS
jgi:hypothetical protein